MTRATMTRAPRRLALLPRALLTRALATTLAVAASLCLAGVFAPARSAETGPVIVIPGRPGVPVMINGVDASYAVVEGDFGLARPGAVPVTVVYGPLLRPNPLRGYGYYPRTGRRPRAGRVEIEPPRNRLRPPSPRSYSRSWSTDSLGGFDVPVTTYAPFAVPEVTLAPEPGRRRRPHRRGP